MKALLRTSCLYRRDLHLPGRFLTTQSCLSSGIRCLPWWFRSTPGTPLRCLCLAAFDFVYRMESGRPLPKVSYQQLAEFLSFAAQQNRILDNKSNEQIPFETKAYSTSYANELIEIETNRPEIGSDRFNPRCIQDYREQVVALALKHSFAITFGDRDWSIQSSASSKLYFDSLFRIAMLCQLADDLIDHRRDHAMNLPSFATSLTGHADPRSKFFHWIDVYSCSSPTSPRKQLRAFRWTVMGVAWLLKTLVRCMSFRQYDQLGAEGEGKETGCKRGRDSDG